MASDFCASKLESIVYLQNPPAIINMILIIAGIPRRIALLLTLFASFSHSLLASYVYFSYLLFEGHFCTQIWEGVEAWASFAPTHLFSDIGFPSGAEGEVFPPPPPPPLLEDLDQCNQGNYGERSSSIYHGYNDL